MSELYFSGSVNTGENQQNPLDFVTLISAVEFGYTGLTLPLGEFKKGAGLAANVNISTLAADLRTIKGVTYANDAAYINALAKQANLNTLAQAIGRFAQPSIIGELVTVDSTTSPTAMAFSDVSGSTVLAGVGGPAGTVLGTDLVEGTAPLWLVQVAIMGDKVAAGPRGGETVSAAADNIAGLRDALAGIGMYVTTDSAATFTDIKGSAVTAPAGVTAASAEDYDGLMSEKVTMVDSAAKRAISVFATPNLTVGGSFTA